MIAISSIMISTGKFCASSRGKTGGASLLRK